MKQLFENWRKLLKEAEVIDFPTQPKISEADLTFIRMVEDSMARRLDAIYGGSQYWPVEKIEKLDELITGLETLLKNETTI